MKKTWMVFGLAGASYDTEMLGLYAVKSFPSYEEAETWVSGEYSTKGSLGAALYTFKKILILEQLETA